MVQGVLVIVLVTAAAWGVSRLMGPTDAQEAVLARMREPLPPVQRNAFPALWLMPYDVPSSQRDSVFAEDLRRMKAMPLALTADLAGPGTQDSVAATRFPTPPMTVEDSSMFCRGNEPCLAKVANDPAAYAALVERHAALLDRVEGLSGYDGLRHSFGLRFDLPLPPYQLGNLSRTRYALLFVQGRKAEAFDGACRAITTWRRIGANSDNLIARMIGTAYGGQAYPHLFAEMLAGTPRDFSLPPSCTEAFARPAGAELSFCQAMRGEFAYQQSAFATVGTGTFGESSQWPDFMLPLVFDEEMTAADSAEMLGYYCRPEVERNMRDDISMPRVPASPGLLRLQCVSNLLGCQLGRIAMPAFDGYVGRVLDANANLRFIGLLLRMREDVADHRSVAVRLSAAQSDVGSAMRALSVGPDGRTARMRNYDTGRGEYWEIPLPPYFQTDGDAASR